MKPLTKRERQIMEILWDTKEPMGASDIEHVTDFSIYTIQQVLQRLLKMNLVKVADVVINRKALMRRYTTVLTYSEYIASTLKDVDYLELVNSYLDSCEDLSALEAFQEKASKRINALKKK